MNWYATPYDITIQAAHAPSANIMLAQSNFLERVSRRIDSYCHRYFYSTNETRYFDGTRRKYLLVPDVLSLTAFEADNDNDGVWDDETWVEDTDYYLETCGRWNLHYPKAMLRITERGSFCFGEGPHRYKATGIWGYGDGERAAPWDLLVPTGTVATTTGTTLTLSAATTELYTGHTILIGTEQMFVSSYSATGTSVTVQRGVNGTTAAIHSTASICKAAYPSDIIQTCKDIVVECMVNRPDLGSQTIVAAGDFQTYRNEEIFYRNLRNIAQYRRMVVG